MVRNETIKIDEAIEILEVLATNKDIYSVEQGKEARQLGIEALAFLKQLRTHHIYITFTDAPRETKGTK